MWWRLGVLAAATAGLLAALFLAPVSSVDVIVELPRTPEGVRQASAAEVETALNAVADGVSICWLRPSCW